MNKWTYKPIYNPAIKGHIPAHHNKDGWVIFNSVSGKWRVINPKGYTYDRKFRTAQAAMNWVNTVIGGRA